MKRKQWIPLPLFEASSGEVIKLYQCPNCLMWIKGKPNTCPNCGWKEVR